MLARHNWQVNYCSLVTFSRRADDQLFDYLRIECQLADFPPLYTTLMKADAAALALIASETVIPESIDVSGM